MDQRALAPLVIVIIVVVAAVGAGVAYVLVSGDGGSGGWPEGENAESITSIDYKMDVAITGGIATMRRRVRDIGSPNIEIRLDTTTAEVEARMILDNGNQEAWLWTSAGGWQDSSAQFGSYWGMYWEDLGDSLDILSDWTGGDYNYTDPDSGASVRFYYIRINPTLSDSLFQPN